MTHILVIGAGQAGATLAITLRQGGFDGSITLVGEEPTAPYQRPPLSKGYLLGKMPAERLLLRPPSFYEQAGIALRTNARAEAIDPIRKRVQVGGASIAYDTLVLATGSVPRCLPAAMGGALSGVYLIRSLADVDAMAAAFQPGARVLVVGGGYIGLEAAAVAVSRGLQVVLVEAAARILQRVAVPQTSEYFRALHRRHGVRIIEGVGLARIEGAHRASGALLGDGTRLEVDFVIVGVGIEPATQLARGAGLRIENGIWTDAFGHTSDGQIWAVGDCASFPWRGGRLRLESVPHAIDHATAVAQNILGAGQPYEAKPWFWSDQYDVKLQMAGWHAGYDRVVRRQAAHAAQGSVSFWSYRGGRFVAVEAMNAPRDYVVGRQMLARGVSPAPKAIAEGTTNLRALLAT
ncbi:MAG: NAD(P)/FAD-dependent oxidoreductase [Rhodobacteraceae bacterium]|nr:NAD(P)/FAD-dependent oxidoreductase [Paracoccaceae bacterium]